MTDIAKTLMVVGIIFIVIGGLFLVFNTIPGIGKLPGDIIIKKDNFTFYFPITTCILLSILFYIIYAIWIKK